MKSFRRGLVVGKFAPLHRGHQAVIDRALAECECVLLVSYANPEPPSCSAERRRHWLEILYPEAERLVVTDELLRQLPPNWPGPRVLPLDTDDEEIHRKFVGDLCLHVLGGPVDAVFTSEDYGDGFAATLTRLFRAAIPGHPPVHHVCVDRARRALPISGTQIRENPHAHREWLAPEVYAAFVERIALLGGESSGKSTLAEALASALGTSFVAEYGRELWEAQGGHLSEADLLKIGQTQIAREEAAARHAVRWLVCDTSPLTTRFYAESMFGRVDPELESLSHRPYDTTVLCAPDFPFVQDGTRRDADFRAQQHTWYERELTLRGIPYLEVTGPLADRIRQIQSILRLKTSVSTTQ